jgi:hypothetical protein
VKLLLLIAPVKLPNLKYQKNNERGRGKRKKIIIKRFEQAKEDDLI